MERTFRPLLVTLALASFARPQQPLGDRGPEFEVASVKPAMTREVGGVHTYPGGRIEFRGCTVLFLIQQAFQIQAFQATGGPPWIHDEMYDIDATVPVTSKSTHFMPAYSKVPMTEEQRQMLESLLVRRFGLKYRRETGEGPVYLLVKGKKPLKLNDSKDKNEYPWAGGFRGGMIVGDGLAGINESMDDLANRLGRYLGRPVLDRTGLTGSYDFRVAYPLEEGRSDVVNMILACVQEIGLKLEPSKAPVETIVIEHVERPSAN